MLGYRSRGQARQPS